MRVFAVVVTYKPDLVQLELLLNKINPQVQGVVLVDNTPRGSVADLNGINAFVIQGGANTGIAAAQNRGISLACERGANFIVLFDQDSIPDDNFVSVLIGQYGEHAVSKQSGVIIGPSVYCEFEKRYHAPLFDSGKSDRETCASVEVGQLISSGMFFDKPTFYKVGPLNEELFIDAVDHEWCWRAAHLGVSIIKSNNVTLFHRLGEGRHKVFGIWTKVTSPHRLYYQMRNTIWLLPVPYVPLYWKVRNLAAIPIKLVLLLLLHSNKKERLRYFFSGLRDGIFRFKKIGIK